MFWCLVEDEVIAIIWLSVERKQRSSNKTFTFCTQVIRSQEKPPMWKHSDYHQCERLQLVPRALLQLALVSNVSSEGAKLHLKCSRQRTFWESDLWSDSTHSGPQFPQRWRGINHHKYSTQKRDLRRARRSGDAISAHCHRSSPIYYFKPRSQAAFWLSPETKWPFCRSAAHLVCPWTSAGGHTKYKRWQ